jgi:hypothetical protein
MTGKRRPRTPGPASLARPLAKASARRRERLGAPGIGVLDEHLQRVAADRRAALEGHRQAAGGRDVRSQSPMQASVPSSPESRRGAAGALLRRCPSRVPRRRRDGARAAAAAVGHRRYTRAVLRDQTLRPSPAELVEFLDEHLRNGASWCR